MSQDVIRVHTVKRDKPQSGYLNCGAVKTKI